MNDMTDAELARKQADLDLRAMLELPAGKRVLWRVLEKCGPFRSTFDLKSDRHSVFLEGRRSIALWLISELGSAQPEGLADLMNFMQAPVAKTPTDQAEADDGE